MAHKQMWFQGDKQNLCVDCGEGYQFTCPKSKRTADEYVRGFYTHTGVINPNTEYDNYGNETPQFKAMKDVKVGDYVWLVCVPPKHRVLDVFAYNLSLSPAPSMPPTKTVIVPCWKKPISAS